MAESITHHFQERSPFRQRLSFVILMSTLSVIPVFERTLRRAAGMPNFQRAIISQYNRNEVCLKFSIDGRPSSFIKRFQSALSHLYC